MLDAFIIERIRRERERQRDGAYAPLHIEPPMPPSEPPRPRREDTDDDRTPDRGSVIIDFQLRC